MAGVPDLESLRLLTLVERHGSLSAAAAELGIAQPSASRRLSTLERRLGLALVDRTKRGSRLTPAGQVVAGWAQRVLTEVAGLLDGAQALRTQRDAELRVAASLTVAEYLAPAWIGELRRQHPALYVGLQVMNSEHVVAQVHDGKVEIGFVESPRAPGGLASRRVAVDQLVVVVAPGHRWTRRRTPLTAQELSSTPLLVRERGSGTRDTLDHALARAGAGSVRPLLELGSTAAVRGAVIAGTGPAVLSDLAVRPDLELGRLVAVPVTGVDLHRALRAIWLPGHTLTGPAAELVAIARR